IPPRLTAGPLSRAEVQSLPLGASMSDVIMHFRPLEGVRGSFQAILYPALEGGHYCLLFFDPEHGLADASSNKDETLHGAVYYPEDESEPAVFVSPPNRIGQRWSY